MLKRKAMQQLVSWKERKTTQALLVTGARQVGKTYIIEEFGRESYDAFIKYDLVNQPDLAVALSNVKSSSELSFALSAYADQDVIPHSTLIFIDEVQECKEVLTFIKYLVQDDSVDYILSGSLLGVEMQNVRSLPVGYLDTLEMHPLDFEEFCWACGVNGSVWGPLRQCFDKREPVLEVVNGKMLGLFHRYLIVGGMPRVVETYVETNDMRAVKSVQDNILSLYRLDISKYAKDDTLLIREAYDQLPSQLDSQSKRFSINSLKDRGTYDGLAANFVWLTSAGVAVKVNTVQEPRHPLRLSENQSFFKLFMNDVGLLSAACGMEVAKSVLSDRLGVNYGSVYENAVAQELLAHGFRPTYYRSKATGELDFVVEVPGGAVLPIEVKSGKDYKRHSALTNVMSSPNYAIDNALVLCEGNISVEGGVTYCPAYMVAMLDRGERPAWMGE